MAELTAVEGADDAPVQNLARLRHPDRRRPMTRA